MSWSRSVAVVLVAILAAACGFRPLYEGRATGTVTADLATIKVNVIHDRPGQQLRNELIDRLNPRGAPKKALYHLDVRLTEARQELGIRKDETATRANIEESATFVLMRAEDGEIVYRGSSRATTSYNIVTSEFGALSAESDARRRALEDLSHDITSRLGLFFNRLRAQDG